MKIVGELKCIGVVNSLPRPL